MNPQRKSAYGRSPGRWVSALAATLAVVVSGCGGGSSESGQRPTNTDTSARTTPTAPPADGRESTIRLEVARAPLERGVTLKYSPVVTVTPERKVIIRARVTPGALETPVKVSIEKRAGEEVKITARAGSLSEVARVKSASATPVKLVGARFTCLIATDSLCPPSRIAETSDAFEYETMAERAQSRGPILIVATVEGG